jgi:hypothetical protein
MASSIMGMLLSDVRLATLIFDKDASVSLPLLLALASRTPQHPTARAV